MQKNAERHPGQSGRRGRRLGLTALAAIALAGAGAAAIYTIHRTMPPTGVDAAQVRTSPTGSSAAQSPPPGADGTHETAASRVPESAPGDAAGHEAAGVAHTGAPTPSPASKVTPPVSLRPPATPEAVDAPEVATSAEPAAKRLQGKRQPPTAASTASTQAAKVQGADARQDRGQRGRRQDQAESAPAERLQDQDARDAGSRPARASRLADAQQTNCGDAGLLSRLICNERVRLRFCRDRWNGHPDCMIDAQRNDF